MQVYDIIMLIVLLVAIVKGYRRGLAWQVASISAIFVSYLVAVRFRDVVAARIDAAAPWNMFLAMLILYIASSVVIWLAFQMVKGGIDRAKLKDFDQQLGAIFGAIKGVVLCVVITFFAVTLLGDSQKKEIIHSRSGYFIAKLLDRAKGVMPRELDQVLGPYLDRLDQQLDPSDMRDDPGDRRDDSTDVLDEFDFQFPSQERLERDDSGWPSRAARDEDPFYRSPTSDERTGSIRR